LTTSLHEKYLLPLSAGPDGGQVLRATLRTYFKAERNSSAAAAALGVTRQTVTSRLKMAEQRIGQPLGDCDIALIAALSLEEVGHVPGPPLSLHILRATRAPKPPRFACMKIMLSCGADERLR